MKLSDLRKANVERCEKVYHLLDEWKATDWACALAGEVGEACNAVKKLKRGDGNIDDIAEEIADVIIYTDLLAAHLRIDLEFAIVNKFNNTSRARKSDIFLHIGD